jgi:ribosomal protein L29
MAKTETSKKKITAPEVQSADKLRTSLAAKEADLLGYRRGHAAGELKNNSIINVTRKDIARLKTALSMEKISKEGEK